MGEKNEYVCFIRVKPADIYTRRMYKAVCMHNNIHSRDESCARMNVF